MVKLQHNFKNSIAETLFITLYMKYKEYQRKDAIIRDIDAYELTRKIDYDFSKFKNATKSQTGVVLRARYFDNAVKEFIKAKDNPVVVLLGCGLDTRFQRLRDVSEKAVFYELDVPEVIEFREKLIPACGNDIYIPLSVFDFTWINDIKNKHSDGDYIVVAEGVLMYFEENRIKDLFVNMANKLSQCEFFFDVISKWLSRNSHIHDTVKYTNASFVWGIDCDKDMECWAANLEHISTKLYCDFTEWKRLGIQGVLMKLLPVFRNAGRMLHYQIK